MRVMLVEDDNFTRETVKNALVQRGITVVHDAENASSAINFLKKEQVDAVVVDYNLGSGPNGVDVAQALIRIQPELGFVLLTGFLDPGLIQAAASALPKGSRYLIKQDLQNIELLINELKLCLQQEGK
jgi:DNA-binding NarL/FixJ family response regulator